MAECKYYKLVRQVSYDSGVTWISLDEFQKGDLYETDSPDCGGGITQYRWVNVSGEYTCVGTTKYQKTKKQQSTDGGQTWRDVSPIEYGTGAVIEYNSQDCIGGNVKLSMTYSNGQTYSKNCDSNSTLTSGETRPNGYVYTAITSAVIGDCVTSIADGSWDNRSVFDNCTSLTSVTIGNNVTEIGYSAFYWCTNLKSITIPNSVITIGLGAFADCTSLTSVTLGNSVENIGNQAFAYCTGVTSITIPNSVTRLGDYAFQLTNIRNVYVPSSVSSMGANPFIGCFSLTSITVDNSNSYFSSLDGVLFNKSKTRVISYPAGLSGSYTIPNTVTAIGGSAFYGCSGLTSVNIQEGVQYLYISCFGQCYGLRSVTLPSTVTYIDGAFGNCWNLRTVTCLATTPPTLTEGSIDDGVDYIYVPAQSVNAYKSASGWSDYSSRIRAIS